MNTLIDYTAYMRGLAERHSALRHTAEEKHFFRGELQEFFEQFRSEVCFPCMIVESSDNSYGGTPHHLTKSRTTSYIIADRYDQHDDYGEVQLRMTRCEQIAEQVLVRLLSDTDSPFDCIAIESLEGQYLQNEGSRYVGYRVTFTAEESPYCVEGGNPWTE